MGLYYYDIEFPNESPVNVSRAIEGKYLSLSIEVKSFPRLLGSASNVQLVTQQCLKLLNQIGGSYPELRVTGMDNYDVRFVDDSTQIYDSQNPASILLDETWFSFFDLYPTELTFTIGLPWISVIRQVPGALQSLVAMTKRTVERLGARLSEFELGNEPDQIEGYTGAQYTEDFLHYASLLRDQVLVPSKISKPMFAFGTFAREYKQSFEIEDLVAAGANSTRAQSLISSFSNHKYPYNNCDKRNEYTVQDLLDHRTATYYGLYNPIKSMPRVLETGWPGMALGEVNSICCGQTGISDSFANAIWLVDYAMYGAFNNISRMSLHFGDLIDYAPWLPADATLDDKPIVHPLFYGMLLVSEALGSDGDSRVALMDWNNRHIIYGIWNAARLRSIVIVNTDNYNSTSLERRSNVSLHLQTEMNNQKYHTNLLQAPFADSRDNIEYAGLTFDTESSSFSSMNIQSLQTDDQGALVVSVQASEVALVIFDYEPSDPYSAKADLADIDETSTQSEMIVGRDTSTAVDTQISTDGVDIIRGDLYQAESIDYAKANLEKATSTNRSTASWLTFAFTFVFIVLLVR